MTIMLHYVVVLAWEMAHWQSYYFLQINKNTDWLLYFVTDQI